MKMTYGRQMSNIVSQPKLGENSTSSPIKENQDGQQRATDIDNGFLRNLIYRVCRHLKSAWFFISPHPFGLIAAGDYSSPARTSRDGTPRGKRQGSRPRATCAEA
ncbi:hypothetical protein [Burkholderia sp. Ac-20379]|uniref:hypothetical protein n=1 Tax=Burkholderia sp. Ac-20379 TaxID=2703900 RepID=UPI00197D44DA|nr:hypothetical protein [Burkholderia sp. Ac-20379]MBN3729070.1 hypothetical protein [Burkholderia sp. Ac-20379]